MMALLTGLSIRNWLTIAGVLAIVGGVIWLREASWNAGYAAKTAEIIADETKRTNDANEADRAAAKCAADPACRVQSDRYRRD